MKTTELNALLHHVVLQVTRTTTTTTTISFHPLPTLHYLLLMEMPTVTVMSLAHTTYMAYQTLMALMMR